MIDYRAVSVRLMISGSFVLTVLLPALTPASAQGVDWGGIMQTEAMNSVVEEIAQQQAADVARRDVSQPLQEKGQEASETDLSYSSSPTRTSRNLRIFLDRSKASNPALADDLERLFLRWMWLEKSARQCVATAFRQTMLQTPMLCGGFRPGLPRMGLKQRTIRQSIRP